MNKTQKITVIAIAVVAAVMFVTPIALGSDSQQASAFGWWHHGWHGGWHHPWWHHGWGWGWHHPWHHHWFHHW